MSRILAIDLGKFKSVTCLLDTETNETEFWTMSTDRPYLLTVLKKYQPDLVVIESCSTWPAGFTTSCTAAGLQGAGLQSQPRGLEVEKRQTQDGPRRCAQVGQAGRARPAGAGVHTVSSGSVNIAVW